MIPMPHGMVEPHPMIDPERFFTCTDLLAGNPPARHFLRLQRVADVIVDQDIAVKTIHLGGDVGVMLIHIETMHPIPCRFLKNKFTRTAAVSDVVYPETAIAVIVPGGRSQQRQVL